VLTRLAGLRQPSLRRRIAVTFSITTFVSCVVLAGSAEVVFNVLYFPAQGTAYDTCTIESNFPAFPSNDTSCSYSPFATVATALVILALLALTGWSWWALSGWVLRPLSVTAETVRRLGPQNLGQRVHLGGGADAFRELADALDDALDRLAAGYDSQRRFAANASHELRTPLAVQRLLTEVAMEDPAAGQDLHRLGAQLLRTNERNESLIEGLLVLAESDRGLQGRVPVRLDELAGDVLDAHDDLAKEHEVTLRRALATTSMTGDPVLLERLIANLVSNAIKYNEPGGWVEVQVADLAAGPVLAVRNTGERVPAELVPTLFEPFRRLGTDRVRSRGGAGLGLAIVRSIVTAHQGTIGTKARQEGGLDLEISFVPRDLS
jgi:signal transduction histidine kinase